MSASKLREARLIEHKLVWPLKECSPLFPDPPGAFGVLRKYDRHAGVDLYCELGTEVVAMASGMILSIEEFTGTKAGSPWWNDSQAVLQVTAVGILVYGEITPTVKPGDRLNPGDKIGVVDTPVLKRLKGRPTVMLHFERHHLFGESTVTWAHGDPCPEDLRDPTHLLMRAAKAQYGAQYSIFSLDEWDGVSFTALSRP